MDESIDSGIVDWVWDDELRVRFRYTDADLATLARLLLRPCPQCQAVPGRWCRTPTGRNIVGLDNQHLARRDISRRSAVLS